MNDETKAAIMTIKQYEDFVTEKWQGYADSTQYTAIALGGECGEVLNEIKKELRTGTPKSHRDAIALELGDTLYYLTRLAHEYDYSLEEIMLLNVSKLKTRYDTFGKNFSD